MNQATIAFLPITAQEAIHLSLSDVDALGCLGNRQLAGFDPDDDFQVISLAIAHGHSLCHCGNPFAVQGSQGTKT